MKWESPRQATSQIKHDTIPFTKAYDTRTGCIKSILKETLESPIRKQGSNQNLDPPNSSSTHKNIGNYIKNTKFYASI